MDRGISHFGDYRLDKTAASFMTDLSGLALGVFRSVALVETALAKFGLASLFETRSIRLDQAPFSTQNRFSLTRAFAVSMSFRIIATMATFAGLPASRMA